MPLENALGVAFVAALAVLHRRLPLTRRAYTAIFVFLSLHTIGAHYTYSEVPYDEWAVRLTGRSVSEIFGWERNHYDRLVHFAYGLLLAYPIREVLVRTAGERGIWGYYLPLAVTSSKRSSLLPDIPTLAEVGVPGIEGSAWIGFVISSKVPADIQKKLSDALIQALRDPEVKKRLQTPFMDPVGSTLAEFRAYMDDELKRWEPLIRKLGIKGQ